MCGCGFLVESVSGDQNGAMPGEKAKRGPGKELGEPGLT